MHFDGTNFRFYIAIQILFIDIVLSVYRILIAVIGFGQLVMSLATLTRREQMFYGPNREKRRRLQEREAVRI